MKPCGPNNDGNILSNTMVINPLLGVLWKKALNDIEIKSLFLKRR
jgi:hypothetical protein